MDIPKSGGATAGSDRHFVPLGSPSRHDGKVAVIAGASANLGRMFAEQLASDGATVIVHYNSAGKQAEAQAVVAGIVERGGSAVAIQGDLTCSVETTRIIDEVIRRFGRWDILVNTAGAIVRKPIAEFTESEFDDLFMVNAKVPFFPDATIVAVTAPTYGGYAGSKSPVEHFTKAFAKEVGSRGITVNCVAPGPLKTSFFYPVETDANLAWLKSMSVNGDIGEPNDIVPLVRFLVSDEARWITAQTVFANGGLVATAS